MRILHMCLSCFYVDNFSYQENVLPRINKQDGHEVKIIASTEIFLQGQLAYDTPRVYFNEDGIEVIRVPYRRFLPSFLMKKIRFYPHIYSLIDEFKPEVILFHGAAAGELLTVSNYVRHNGNVKLYVDSHESYNNSGTTWLSLEILHRFFYRLILKYSKQSISSFLCIGTDSIKFMNEVYDIPKEDLEFYPLGGVILPDNIYIKTRAKARHDLQLDNNELVFFHSGKIDKLKKTIELIKAFSLVDDSSFRLIIAGIFLEDVKEEIENLIEKDNRITFLGWKNPKELESLLCAADVYIQPGSVSATLQNAMCNRCAIVVNDVEEYIPFVNGNGFFVKDEKELLEVYKKFHLHPECITIMKENSLKKAKEMLDYEKLAARLYR